MGELAGFSKVGLPDSTMDHGMDEGSRPRIFIPWIQNQCHGSYIELGEHVQTCPVQVAGLSLKILSFRENVRTNKNLLQGKVGVKS